jgi:hypothetical protein
VKAFGSSVAVTSKPFSDPNLRSNSIAAGIESCRNPVVREKARIEYREGFGELSDVWDGVGRASTVEPHARVKATPAIRTIATTQIDPREQATTLIALIARHEPRY